MTIGSELDEVFPTMEKKKEIKIDLKFDESAYFNSEGIKVLIRFLAGAKRKHQQGILVQLKRRG